MRLWIQLLLLRLFDSFYSVETVAQKCANESEVVNELMASSYDKRAQTAIVRYFGVLNVSLLEQNVPNYLILSSPKPNSNSDLYVNEFWMDTHLSYTHLNPCKQNFSLDYTLLNQIWTPNTCFVNSKQSIIHQSPFVNVFLMIFPNGTVWTNYRMQVTGPCSLDLIKFPMDIQHCELSLLSYNYNREYVHLRWRQPTPVLIFDKIELPDFVLTDHTTTAVSRLYPGGTWDELSVQFVFARRSGWYILQAYVPTYLTVVISWIGFFLGTRAIPARTMIGINSLLAMTFQFGNVIRNLPRVSYVKAIDVWMLRNAYTADHIFTYNSPTPTLRVLTELDLDVSCKHEPPRTRRKKKSRLTSTASTPCTSTYGDEQTMNRQRATRVDAVSTLMFPGAFVLFNALYWGVYMR